MSFTAAAQYRYMVRITGLPDALNGKGIILTVEDEFSDNRYTRRDTAVITNNSVQFAGNMFRITEAAALEIAVKGALYQNSFVLDTGQNNILVKPVNKRSFAFKNPISNIVLPASEANQLYLALANIEYGAYVNIQKGAASLESQKQSWRLQLAAITQYPDCFYSLVRLYQLRKVIGTYLHYDSILNTFKRLAPEVSNSALGRELLAKLQAEQAIKIGNTAPAFAIPDTKGTIITNTLLSGKVYLLAFGAPWCGPCIKGYDHLKKLYKQYKSAGFEIVYVNVDSSRSKWLTHIAQYRLPWVNVAELKQWYLSPVAMQYGVKFIPTYYIINRQGKIVYNPYELNDLDKELLDQYLAAALKQEP